MEVVFFYLKLLITVLLYLCNGSVAEDEYMNFERSIETGGSLTLAGIHALENGIIKRSKKDIPIKSHPYYEEIDECGGLYKNFTTLITSPNYSLKDYDPGLDCEYIIFSPYRCPNEFHIQFLDFQVETSKDCSKDYLTVGTESPICGQIIGINNYKTEDGVLVIKFRSDDTVENKGFKLLVTRQPCKEDFKKDINEITSSSSTTKLNRVLKEQNQLEITSNHLLPPLKSLQSTLLKSPLQDKKIQTNNKQYLPPTGYLPHIPGYIPVNNNNNNDNNGYLPPINPFDPTQNPSAQFPVNNPQFNPNNIAPPFNTNNNNNNPSFNGNNYPYYPNNNNIPSQNIPSFFCYPINQNYPWQTPTNSYPQTPVYPQYPNFNPTIDGGGNIPSGNYPRPIETSNSNIYPFNATIYYPNESPSLPPPALPSPQLTISNNEFPSNHLQPQVILPWQSQTLPSCCSVPLQYKRFYISSPGFPRSSNYPTDCLYIIRKFSPNICRLRIQFKFFNLGVPTRLGNGFNAGPINGFIPQVACFEDFIEIDGQQLCGCRTNLVYMSQWGFGDKIIRLRQSGRSIGQTMGFILDILQEDCPYRYLRNINHVNSSKAETDQNRRRSDNTEFNINDDFGHKAIVETNSTSRTSIYLQNRNGNKRSAVKPSEGPSSQFFWIGSNRNQCIFTPADYLRLTLESLWITKPVCIPPTGQPSFRF